MAEHPSESFELVGDPDALPDAFFEALAALLLDREQAGGSSRDAGQESRHKARAGERRRLRKGPSRAEN